MQDRHHQKLMMSICLRWAKNVWAVTEKDFSNKLELWFRIKDDKQIQMVQTIDLLH